MWGRYALAALLPLSVLQPALATAKVSDADLEISAPATGTRLDPKAFEFVGNILVDQEALAKALAAWSGRNLSGAEWEQAAAAVVEHLRGQGHASVKVSLASERGNVRVRVDSLTPTEKAYAEVKPVAPVVDIRTIVVTGATQASAQELQSAVAPWVGRALTVAELQEPARAVTDLLKGKGASLAQAFVPAQDLKDGELRVQVVEGIVDGATGLSGVVVKGVGRTDVAVVARTIAPGAVAGQPLRAADLEQRLMLANELPGLKLKASLIPGTQFGTTAVEVVAEEERATSTQFYTDNHGNTYTGQARAGVDVDVYSPSGNGDLLSLGAVVSQDAGSGKLAWSAPVDFKDGRFGVSLAASHSKMSPQNIDVRFDGKSQQVGLFGQFPVTRRADASVTALVSVDNKQLSNDLEGMLFDKRDVNSLSLGMNGSYLTADRLGQGRWTATLSSGNVQLRERMLSLNPRLDTEGGFTKFVGDYRLTRPLATEGVAASWSINARASGQLHVTGSNLDNAEKFQLGGPDGVRAYPVGEGSGDAGFLASFEISRPFTLENVQASRFFMFVDAGTVTRNAKAAQAAEASDGMPNHYSLHGLGLGFKLDFKPTLSLQMTAAAPWGDNPAQVNGLNTDARSASQSRYWLSVNSRF